MTAPPPPDLLVVVLDCVRAKSVGPDGARRVARTPFLDRIAARGTLFRRAVAPANWTVPSHMSLFTGTFPWEHRLRSFRKAEHPPPRIAEWLCGRGYDTAVFTEEVHLVAGYGLEEGYTQRYATRMNTLDEERTTSNRLFGQSGFVYSKGVRTMIERIPRLAIPLSAINFRSEAQFKREVCGEFVVDAFDRWLSSRPRENPVHAFLNFVDAHEPYPELAPRPMWGASASGFVQVPRYYLLAVPGLREQVPWSTVEAAYLSAIERADAKLARLWQAVERAGRADRTMIVVTADHGQSFGEGGNVYHGCGATDSVLRVPLVVGAPTEFELPKVVNEWTSLCDIPSWLKSAALGRAPFDPDGQPTISFPTHPPGREPVLAEGGPASDPNRSLEGVGLDHRWNHRLLAAYAGNQKWVWDLVSGELWHWRFEEDADATRAEGLTGSARLEALRRAFGVEGENEAARFLGEPQSGPRPALGDARMRSWGYD